MSCRSREGAWIEIGYDEGDIDRPPGRSREGAWIEILHNVSHRKKLHVAPVRERGLKLL